MFSEVLLKNFLNLFLKLIDNSHLILYNTIELAIANQQQGVAF